jgi:signal transduction histidine kinase
MNKVIILNLFVMFEILVFTTIYYEPHKEHIEMEQSVISVFLILVLFIVFEILALMTVEDDMRINRILEDMEQGQLQRMDIETGLENENRNTRERIASSFHLCDNA